MTNQTPILITGAHRSGTTWVGKMLTAASGVGYIQEPFNLQHRPGICRRQFEYWFTYVTDENQAEYYDDVKGIVDFSYNLKGELKAIDSTRDALRLTRDFFNFQKYRLTNARPLIKDPIAFFSSEWFAKNFNADVVVTIRHPAAFVSGLMVKNWEFEFSHFLAQPLLMRDYLSPFREQIEDYAAHRKPLIDQGILLWNIFYSVIDDFRQKHPSWIFVRHEDLANEPLAAFEALYNQLGLAFTAEQASFIEHYTTADNPSKAPTRKKIFGSNIDLSVKRSSRSSIKNWKNRLSPEQIERIRTHTSAVADKFYDVDDWA